MQPQPQPKVQLVLLKQSEINGLTRDLSSNQFFVIEKRLNRGVRRAWSGNPLLQFMTPEQIKCFIVININRMLSMGKLRIATNQQITAYIDSHNFKVVTRSDGKPIIHVSCGEIQDGSDCLEDEMLKKLRGLRKKVIHELQFPRIAQFTNLLQTIDHRAVNCVNHQGCLSLILALPQ